MQRASDNPLVIAARERHHHAEHTIAG